MFLEPLRSRNFKKRKNIKSKRKDLKIFAFFLLNIHLIKIEFEY